MARLLATDVQYILNRLPGDVWNKMFAEGREMINFFGGFKPYPKGKPVYDNGVIIPVAYSQNASVASYTEGTANPTAGHSSKRNFSQPWKRYHGATGIDGLLAAINEFQGIGLGDDLLVNEMVDLQSAAFNAINTDLATDGSGNSGYVIQGVFYHVTDTGTWNTADKASLTYLQSYVSDNSGTDRSLTKVLLDDVFDTMKFTRRVTPTDIVFGSEAFHAYEELYADYRQDTGGGVRDLYLQGYGVNGNNVTRLPIDTNHILILRKSDWDLYYLPQKTASPDKLQYVEGPWKVEQVATGTDSEDFVVRIYVTLVCRNPYAQAALQDVQI